MTDKEKLEAIKTYIIDCGKEAEGEIYYEYCKLAGFIERLPDDSAIEDIEEAAEDNMPGCRWAVDDEGDGAIEDGFDTNQMIAMFKAGAEWKEKRLTIKK